MTGSKHDIFKEKKLIAKQLDNPDTGNFSYFIFNRTCNFFFFEAAPLPFVFSKHCIMAI